MTHQSTDSTLACMPNPALVSEIANQPLHAFPKSPDFRPKFSDQHSRQSLSPGTIYPKKRKLLWSVPQNKLKMRPDMSDSFRRTLLQWVGWGAMGHSWAAGTGHPMFPALAD